MAEKHRLNPFSDSSKDFPFFPSQSHRKGAQRIVRGLESACGLILLTGEIGIGKTSLSRYIQGYLASRFVFVELGNPYQTPLEQAFQCCEKFNVHAAGMASLHDCVDALEAHFRFLVKEGRKPVIVFEESHLLTKRHLSLIHILSNLRAHEKPLVQILIVGQLEILELLDMEGMEALNQRIGVRCRLAPLIRSDVDKYIRFKLEAGGFSEGILFSPKAVERIWRASGGIPRLINHLCGHVFDGTASGGTTEISADMVVEVCKDSVYSGLFQPESGAKLQKPRHWWWAAAMLVVAVVIVIAGGMQGNGGGKTASASVRLKVVPLPAGAAADRGSTSFSASAGKDKESKDILVTVDEPPLTTGIPEKNNSMIGVESDGSPFGGKGGDEDGFRPANGDSHPVVGRLVLGAIAWNTDPLKRFAVVDSKLVRTGEAFGGITVADIGQDFVVLEFEGKRYKRSISR